MADKKKSLTNAILFALEKTVDGAVRSEDFLTHSYIYARGYDRPLKKSALAQALKRLREKGFIEKEHDEGKIIFKLTQLGREFLTLYKSDEEIKWDGKWRLVAFDIPENKRGVRDILRGRLKLWGFTPWQQSVWASKKNITNKLRELVKGLGIEDWVLVIESDNVK